MGANFDGGDKDKVREALGWRTELWKESMKNLNPFSLSYHLEFLLPTTFLLFKPGKILSLVWLVVHENHAF